MEGNFVNLIYGGLILLAIATAFILFDKYQEKKTKSSVQK